jgi:CheY-like chemotaxis protein
VETNRPDKPNDGSYSAKTDTDSSRPITILVTDDEPDMRLYLRHCLKTVHKDIVILEAIDGLDALVRLQQTNVDLLITDVVMPRMDGFELCRVVLQDAGLSHVSILFVTGELSAREVRERIGDFGPVDVLAKPFNADQLSTKVTEILNRLHDLSKTRQKPEDT